MKKLFMLGLMAVTMFTLSACSNGVSAASTIAIDVNPSVVLELDENDEVINVVMNNEDAQIIVGDMDLIGVDYNVAINALIGSMVANGYISELANSVLLSVQNNDATKETELRNLLTQAVEDYLTSSAIEGSVITRSLDLDDDAEELAESLNISEAKAELILDIIEVDPRMTVEELAVLSINDLNLLLESKNYAFDNIVKSGSASELGLISAVEAYQNALLELGLEETEVVEYEVELEQEDGIIVYDIEVETSDNDFEIMINAKDGTLFVESDEDDDEEVFPEDALLESAILDIVAVELGIDLSLVTELEVEQEVDNGVAYYEIEFEYEGAEYELEIDALSGEIYTNSMDVDGFDYDDDEDDEDEEDYDDDEDEEDEEDETEEDSESTETSDDTTTE